MLNNAARDALALWGQAAGGLAGVLEGTDDDWHSAREQYLDAMAGAFPVPQGVEVASVDMGGVAADLVTPDCDTEGRVLLYIHGGGYASGGPRAYHGLAGRFAKRQRAKVYVPDYRLAPQHRFPIPLDDVFSAYRFLIELGCDPAKIALSGDSAGGAMVVTTMRKARDAGLPLPVSGVAISPWANLCHTGNTCVTREGIDPLCTIYFLNLLARNFLGDTPPDDPDASPVFADVRGLSPILIQVGENEVMLSDAVRLAGHLAESRVRTSLEVWPGMFHVWPLFSGILAEADAALENAGRFIDDAIAESAKS